MTERKKISILYVDDEEINLFLFKSLFELEFDVITSSSGDDALNLLNNMDGQIDVIISDMNMPEMNGLEFIASAREKYGDIVYFILSGYNVSDEIDQAIRDEIIRQYFSKPFTYDDIAEAVLDAKRQN